ncbi:TfoX/Sxy family protein [Allorhizocola rhizosphaerae]|uniref:TfoX/Sxy family protein n=1 Tax=Allorhizocola rhizosphaerae TaxID=1872709 RepID=UPI000E3E1E80|nr:TfoX/Sxy family protein [Allorhizocola rhizosphaerae]
MAYDEELANRVRELAGKEKGLTEQRMFGGLAMLINGNMAVAVRGKGGGLLVRVGEAQREAALAEKGTDEMMMRGKAMRGWITVEPSACAKQADLRRWVTRGVSFARTLPPK